MAHKSCIDKGHLGWYGKGGCVECVAESMNEPKMAEEKKPVADTKFIQGVAEELKLTLAGKNEDYAMGGEFSNFEGSGQFAGVQPFHLILAQIGIKYTRIATLHNAGYEPNNESLRDSLIDLAGYSVIAAAWLDAVQADQALDFEDVR